MTEIETIIFALTLFIIVIYLNYKMIARLVHFFRNHLSDIIEFAEKNGFILIEVQNPKRDDWKRNPFNNKNSYFLELALPFSLYSHKIFTVADSKKTYQTYWIQTISPLFGKNQIHFKKSDSQNFEYIKTVEANKVIVTDKCPACYSKVMQNDIECENCGLRFD